MTDSSDLPQGLTPPPHEPMPEQRKQAMREQLLGAVATDRSGTPPARRPGWLVPTLAAASVAAIVAGGLALAGGDGSNDSGTQIVPAGTSGPTPDSPAPTPRPDHPRPEVPGANGPVDVIHTSTAPGMTVPEEDATADPPSSQSCADAVDEQSRYGESEIAGATVTASRPGAFGTTYLYETKTAWIVCDDFTAGDGGAPTLLDAHLKTDDYEPTQRTIGISQNIVGLDRRSWKYQYFAAGRDFDGVRAISYAFPDGHTEDAVVGQNGLWSMNYQPTSGPLANADTNFSTLDPIHVIVSYTDAVGGGADEFTLRWGAGTCGQVNHGC